MRKTKKPGGKYLVCILCIFVWTRTEEGAVEAFYQLKVPYTCFLSNKSVLQVELQVLLDLLMVSSHDFGFYWELFIYVRLHTTDYSIMLSDRPRLILNSFLLLQS